MIKSEAINRSISYIMDHLDEDISIDDVAACCHFSKYHFCRMFKEATGESVYTFIKRMKMNQSALRLQIEKGKSITDIGLDYGYSSTNYSAVFKKQHEVAPAQYRKVTQDKYVPSPYYRDGYSGYLPFEEYQKIVTVQQLSDFTVIYERFIGNYIELADKWGGFIDRYDAYRTDGTLFIERTYDDPSITRLDQCIYDMCMTVDKDCSLEHITVIEGGRYAVCPYKGAVAGIYNAFQGMFHCWLPGSGYEMDQRYGLSIYHVIDSENMYVEMDLCIPVKQSKNS